MVFDGLFHSYKMNKNISLSIVHNHTWLALNQLYAFPSDKNGQISVKFNYGPPRVQGRTIFSVRVLAVDHNFKYRPYFIGSIFVCKFIPIPKNNGDIWNFGPPPGLSMVSWLTIYKLDQDLIILVTLEGSSWSKAGQVWVWTIESEIFLFILYEWDNPSKIRVKMMH